MNARHLSCAQPSGRVAWSCAGPHARVGFLRSEGGRSALDHDSAAKARVAESIAELLGLEFAGVVGMPQPGASPLYLVPSQTLVSLALGRRLGVQGLEDFFGGVVPHAFVATKLVAHPLVRPDAPAPAGWVRDPAWLARLEPVTLPGWSVFSPADAREAARRLLPGGEVRLKDPAAAGGVGQWVVGSMEELDAHLCRLGEARIGRSGLVLERHLRQVRTYSVGQVQVGPHRASYHGIQVLTRNHRGVEVYGGSTLVVVRGGFDALRQATTEPGARAAVERAMAFHEAVMAAYPGILASRCNYDVAEGQDRAGRALGGVLEQSWRIGGASGAEIAALRALRDAPGRRRVRACTCETYAREVNLPPGARVLYDGPDGHGGRLVKHVQVNEDVDA